MKHNTMKGESVVSDNDESVESIFQKMADQNYTSQVGIAVSFDNPKREELLKKIRDAAINEKAKHNIDLILRRIERAAFPVSGFTQSEIEHYQSLFAKDFYDTLYSENYQTYIEDRVREMHLHLKGLEQEYRTKEYELSEDRVQDENYYTEVERYREYLEKMLVQLNNPVPEPIESRTDKITGELIKYGFFEIPRVKELSELGKRTLIELIATNGVPYDIAMLEYLGFLKHLWTEHFTTKEAMNHALAKCFNVSDRTVSGNIYALSEKTRENKSRYTADKYKQTVQNDYNRLK